MILFKVLFDDRALRRRCERASRAFSDLKPEMEKVGKWLVEDARGRIAARSSPDSKGRLGKSLAFRAYKAAVTIFSFLPYARIQQEGGTVLPRKRKMLAIPLRPDLRRLGMWPKHWKRDRLACIKTGKGLFLKVVDPTPKLKSGGARKNSFSSGELVYKLVYKSVIRGRPFLVKSAALIRYMRETIAAKLKGI